MRQILFLLAFLGLFMVMALRVSALPQNGSLGNSVVNRSGIVIGGQNKPGFLQRSLDFPEGNELTFTAGFELPVGKNFECNLMIQKANVATPVRIVIRGNGDNCEIGYYTKGEFRKLFPVSVNQLELTLECDNTSRQFTVTVNGSKSEAIPFTVGIPAIDMIMMSVPDSSDGVILNLFRYTLKNKAGEKTSIEADFDDPAEYNRFKRSGYVQQKKN